LRLNGKLGCAFEQVCKMLLVRAGAITFAESNSGFALKRTHATASFRIHKCQDETSTVFVFPVEPRLLRPRSGAVVMSMCAGEASCSAECPGSGGVLTSVFANSANRCWRLSAELPCTVSDPPSLNFRWAVEFLPLPSKRTTFRAAKSRNKLSSARKSGLCVAIMSSYWHTNYLNTTNILTIKITIENVGDHRPMMRASHQALWTKTPV